MKYALFLMLAGLLFCRCMTTALPQVVIPEQTGKANVGFSIGTNGVHLNTMYTTKFGLAILGNVGAIFGVGGSVHSELSLGFVRPGNLLVSLGLGHSDFATQAIFYGGTYGIYYYWGRFTSLSFRVNKQFDKRIGMTNSLLFIRGKESGSCPLRCDEYTDHAFSAMYYEPVLYLRGKKKSSRYFFLSGKVPLQKPKPEPPDDRFFNVSPVHAGFGFNFPRSKQKS